MDISKLPKLSNTDPPPPNVADAEQDVAPIANRAVPMVQSSANPADVWISIAIGALTLLMYPRFLQWGSHRLFGTHFNPFVMPDGTVVPYSNVPEFWSDLGPTLFGVVLIVEGIALATARRGVMMFAFALTVIATGYNFIFLVTTYGKYGLPLVSALAVAFGVYIAIYQWKLIQEMRFTTLR